MALTEPKQPRQMADPIEWCRFWRDMDAHYSTTPDSPLHHDMRCEHCGH